MTGCRRLLLALMPLLWIVASAAAEQAPRTLLISLDAVPYRVAAEIADPALGDQASFQAFKGPVPLVSTFPSSTSVALVGLLAPLGLERSPGYEARFFDWEAGRVRGGGPISYQEIRFPWREFFDWSRRGPVGSAVEAIRPVRSGIDRLRGAIDEFVASEVDVFLIYIAATDTAVHVVGPDAVKELLRAVDAMLVEARALRPDRPFETVIFSDHGVAGGDPLESVTAPVKKALKAAGLRPSKRLKSDRHVALTPFGLVSNFEAYTRPGVEERVAEVVTSVEGVDLCAYRHGAGWIVTGKQGHAQFRCRGEEGGVLWRYEVEGTDPLGYESVIAELELSSSAGESWVRDEDLFQATKSLYHPDALHRIATSFELVTNPASVICSLAPGYMYGAKRTELLAKIGKGRLRWTHGALNRDATLGFLMSDADYWNPPEVARFDRCLLPFRDALSRHPHVGAPSDP